MSDLFGLLLLMLEIAALLAAYFVPAIVASRRKVPHTGSVIVVNVFLGWTVIGWVVALAMACRSIPPRPALPPPGAPPPSVHPAPPPLPPPARWPHAGPGYRRLP